MRIDEATLTKRIRRQHNLYINSLTANFNHRTQRLVKEISYGLLAKQSILISEIARSLNEPKDLKVTMNRLIENLAGFEFYTLLEIKYMKTIKDYITADTVISIDDGDIVKPRARKLEGLAGVWDGSDHEESIGYPLFVAVAVKQDRDTVIPILVRLFSRLEKSYISDNIIVEDFTNLILGVCGTTPIYVFDRWFCSLERQKTLENAGVLYVMRATGRNITNSQGKVVDLFSWAREKPLPYSTIITSIRNGKEVMQNAWYCVEEITIEELKISCVIMRIEGHDICILFSNKKIGAMRYAAYGAHIIAIYGHRWSIEEFNRFKKQIFDYENMRVQSLRSMKNMSAIVTITAGFIAHLGFLRKSLSRMSEHIIEIGKPIREEVRFPHYRIAAGIKVLLERRQKPAFSFKNRHKAEPSPVPLLDEIE